MFITSFTVSLLNFCQTWDFSQTFVFRMIVIYYSCHMKLWIRPWFQDTEIWSSKKDKFHLRLSSLFNFRISGRNCTSSSRHDHELELEDFNEIAQCSHWMFSKLPFKTSLLAGQSHEVEDVAVRMFNSTLVYTGLELSSMFIPTLNCIIEFKIQNNSWIFLFCSFQCCSHGD